MIHVCARCVTAAERHEESNRGALCCLSGSCLSSSLPLYIYGQPYQGTRPSTETVQIHEVPKGLKKAAAAARLVQFESICLCFYVHLTEVLHCRCQWDTYVCLYYRGIAVFVHPQSRLHQQVPSLLDVRGWLLTVCDIMQVTAESYHARGRCCNLCNMNGCAKVCWYMYMHASR